MLLLLCILQVLVVEAVSVTNHNMSSWLPAPAQEGGTGGGTIQTNGYTGPAYVLRAVGLTNGGMMLIECSTNLLDWEAFPGPGCYLTLTATNPVSIVTGNPKILFWRARK